MSANSLGKLGKSLGHEPKWARRSLKMHMMMVGCLALALVLGVGGWAYTTELASAVIAPGSVVVDSNVKKIQHPDGGIISEIMVREGETVKAGQELFRLDGTPVKAQLVSVESSLASLYALRGRLRAELRGEATFLVDSNEMQLPATSSYVQTEQAQLQNRQSAMAGMKNQLKARQAQLDDEFTGLEVQLNAIAISLEVINSELVGVEKLYKKGVISMQRWSELKRQRAELEGRRGGLIAAKAQTQGRKSEIGMQILQLDEDRRADISKEQAETETKIAAAEQTRLAAMDQLRRLDIVSPVDGDALQLAVHTVNGVIRAGETLLTVVPKSKALTIEAKIKPNDIDQVRIGQQVRIRFSGLNQHTTPEVIGNVTTIAADIVTDPVTNIPYYPVRIHPDNENIAKLKSISLYPGMMAEIFIKTGDRSVMSYLMKPFSDQMQHAFRED